MIYTQEQKYVYLERDHSPKRITYPVDILDIKRGEQWNEESIWLLIKINGDLDELSPDNELGKIRWVLDYAVSPGTEYSYNVNFSTYWNNIMFQQLSA